MDYEYHEQKQVFEWADMMTGQYPELEYLNGSLNGLKLSTGMAVKAKKAGMRKGHPDINLPVRRGGFSGLYIELKCGKNKCTPDQERWLAFLDSQGYYSCACWGAKMAITVIEAYLRNELH